MRNNVGIIACYFGNLPNYFQLWLNSCKKNLSFTWLLFTDDLTYYDYPENVIRYSMKFDEIVEKIKSICDFEISIPDAYKLCDFKVLYGIIFEEYLKEYTHWGHCDLDIIWGDLEVFITDELLEKYDRLFRFGHLSIYKNTLNVNNYFRKNYSGLSYKTILSNPNHFGFDESKGITLLYKDNNLPQYDYVCCADINFYHYSMIANGRRNISGQYFCYMDGKIYSFSKKGKMLEEFAYIHLQKRKMNVLLKNSTERDNYYIFSDCFSDNKKENSCLWNKIEFKLNAYYKALRSKIKWNLAWKWKWINR